MYWYQPCTSSLKAAQTLMLGALCERVGPNHLTCSLDKVAHGRHTGLPGSNVDRAHPHQQSGPVQHKQATHRPGLHQELLKPLLEGTGRQAEAALYSGGCWRGAQVWGLQLVVIAVGAAMHQHEQRWQDTTWHAAAATS